LISVLFGGDFYQFSSGDWYGVSRGERTQYSGYFPGANTRAPLCIYPGLRSAALEQGYDKSVFSSKSKEDTYDDAADEAEKPRRKSRAKKKSDSISIF